MKHIFYCILAVFFVAAISSCKEGKEGPAGKPGSVVTIGTDGFWYIDGNKTTYKAVGENGSTPSIGIDGYWYIDGIKTDYKATGSTLSIGTDGYWYIDGEKTEYIAGVYSGDDMIIVAKYFSRINAEAMQLSVDFAKEVGANQLLFFPDQIDESKYPGVAKILNNSKIDLWLIAPTFYHDDNRSAAQIDDFGREPNWAICDDGEIAWENNGPAPHPSGSWVRFVCPNDHDYLDYRINYLKDALRKCDFTGISLDFMRYFVYWEGAYSFTDPKTFRNACFCDDCIAEFATINSTTTGGITTPLIIEGTTTVEKATFIKNKYFRQWTNYKCGKIDKTVEYVLSELRKEFPNLKANIHAVPWKNDGYGGAIKSIAGQDFALLSNRLDQITPMTYNFLVDRPASWINEVTSDVFNVVNGKIPVIPTIEVRGVSDSHYEAALTSAIKSPSSGVVIWRFEDITNRPAEASKREITERILNNK